MAFYRANLGGGSDAGNKIYLKNASAGSYGTIQWENTPIEPKGAVLYVISPSGRYLTNINPNTGAVDDTKLWESPLSDGVNWTQFSEPNTFVRTSTSIKYSTTWSGATTTYMWILH